MNITDVRVRKITNEGKMKCIVSITFDNLFVVISGVVIFKSITYSSLSSFNISLAASKSKSTPSMCG